MPRYLSQRNGYSCVPVALINLAKWLGLGWSYRKHYERAMTLTQCDPKSGTCRKRFALALVQMKVKFDYLGLVNTADITAALDDGMSVVLGVAWYNGPNLCHHMLMIADQTDDEFQVINGHTPCGMYPQTERWMGKQEFAEEYMTPVEGFPFAITIEK